MENPYMFKRPNYNGWIELFMNKKMYVTLKKKNMLLLYVLATWFENWM